MSTNHQSHMKHKCDNQQECLKKLQLFLDGEASPEQCEDFKSNINECMPCFQHYHFDKAIKELLKIKCVSQAPPDLIENIKSKIK